MTQMALLRGKFVLAQIAAFGLGVKPFSTGRHSLRSTL